MNVSRSAVADENHRIIIKPMAVPMQTAAAGFATEPKKVVVVVVNTHEDE